MALANGKEAGQVVKDTVSRMIEAQTRFIAGVLHGIEEANSGDTVDHEEVRTGLERLLIS